MGTILRHRGAVRSVLIAAIALAAAPASAQQQVMMILGNGVSPAQLREGSRPRVSDVIQADPQTIVVLLRKWSVSNDFCEDWVILRGRTYRVEAPTPGRCRPGGNGDELQRAMGGEQILAHLTARVMFTDDPKADDPRSTSSPQVSRLRRDMALAKKNRNNTPPGRPGAPVHPAPPAGPLVVSPPRPPAPAYPQGSAVRNVMGRCLDVAGGINANRTNVQIFECNGSASQQWLARDRAILNVMGRCLDVAGGISANRTNVQIFDCNGTASQRWVFTDSGEIRNAMGRCLEVAGGVNANRTNVQIFQCNGTRSQKWNR